VNYGGQGTMKVEGPDQDGVLVVTLNRPERLNTTSPQMYDELSVLLRKLRNPADVGAVVITGAGRAFCAGVDIKIMEQFSEEPFRTSVMEDGVNLCQEFLRVRPPVITAINGPAVGFGAVLALLGDIVYMSEDAVVLDPHVKSGIVAGDGGALLWPALIGPSRAKEFLLTGDPMDAKTAFAYGLVNHVVTADRLMPEAMAMATRLAKGARHAIAWTKQVVNIALLREADYKLPLGNAHEARTQSMPDMLEGTAAFFEKRTPVFPSAQPSGAH
jgi:enoyl-CoA hydratase